MSTLLKDRYSPKFIEDFSGVLDRFLDDFDPAAFRRAIFDTDWPDRELKARATHIASVLYDFLPNDYHEALTVIQAVMDDLLENPITEDRFVFFFFPQYIERYGQEYFAASVAAMELMTGFVTCEFAVRPFIQRYPDRMLPLMRQWARHTDEHVRRLASEGCRPRLPWGMALATLKQDPSPILPILETLKNDPSEYVRRSVANNLNDIAKDNPEITLRLAKAWKGLSAETDWVVKHACRTLLKAGHPEALLIFGYSPVAGLEVADFDIRTPEVAMGDDLVFAFVLKNPTGVSKKLRVEYRMDFMKSNGKLAPKVFMISEGDYAPGDVKAFVRKQSFRPISTRKYYAGLHRVAVLINGVEMVVGEFVLV